MAQFALLYGAHAYHYHTFAVRHIPSYAIKLLKQNGKIKKNHVSWKSL
jgi:hypothetical protein